MDRTRKKFNQFEKKRVELKREHDVTEGIKTQKWLTKVEKMKAEKDNYFGSTMPEQARADRRSIQGFFDRRRASE
jgi:hypothetical protein